MSVGVDDQGSRLIETPPSKEPTTDISASPAMKVLHICETVKGGIATYINLITCVSDDLVENVFLVPQSQRTELKSGLVVRAFKRRGRGLKDVLSLAVAAWRAVKAESPRLVFLHSTWTLPVLLALRLGRFRGAVIYCAHGWAALRYPAGSWKQRFVETIEGRLCGLADRVINISHFELEQAHSKHYHGTHVLIENAVADTGDINPNRIFSDAPDAIHLLFVGRFDRQKGLDFLLAGFARASANNRQLRLHVVGEAVLQDGTCDVTEPCQGVRFHGWQKPETLPAFYESADCVVVPSRWEGFGLVVAEALRAGRPVLVSDRGALPSLVSEGETGFVVPLEIDALADAFEKLDKGSLRAMRKACRETYQSRFHEDRFRKELRSVYEDLGVLSARVSELSTGNQT